jgi:hypothetical protein
MAGAELGSRYILSRRGSAGIGNRPPAPGGQEPDLLSFQAV